MAHHRVKVTTPDGTVGVLKADVVLIATGASPRVLPDAVPDGERILNWRQLYDLDRTARAPGRRRARASPAPSSCNAYTELGRRRSPWWPAATRSCRTRTPTPPRCWRRLFAERGVTLVKNARADSVTRTADGVLVTMADGRTVEGSHALMTVGSVPNTSGLGLERVGIELGPGDYLTVDRVSRTSVSGIYAAGDCTGLLLLASVAAMQGRIAMYHALGEGVAPIRLRTVAAAVFTRPEIAAVGVPQAEIDDGTVPARTIMLPLTTNARAKMSLPAARLRQDLLPARPPAW